MANGMSAWTKWPREAQVSVFASAHKWAECLRGIGSVAPQATKASRVEMRPDNQPLPVHPHQRGFKQVRTGKHAPISCKCRFRNVTVVWCRFLTIPS